MPRVELQSTSLKAAIFQEQSAFLDLEFRNGMSYRYHEVPAEVYEQLLRAESKGQYFNQHIRNHFRFTKIHPARGATCDSVLLEGAE
jgi:hypothetical protein